MSDYTFCTYFDKNYLTRGFALYQSLKCHIENFSLWILCLDELTLSILSNLNLPGVKLLSLAQLESWEPRLPASRSDRSRVEYYWTCTPTLLAYVISQQAEHEIVSYLDADLFFFSSPKSVFIEMGNDSILIHSHRYSSSFRYKEKTSGIYNVGMTGFRNNLEGWQVLKWWQSACLTACYLRPEEGYCGDQKYLDDWPAQFQGVHVLENIGAGLAPWNLKNYRLWKEGSTLRVNDIPVIFFHFHAMKMMNPRMISQIGYDIAPVARRELYQPYLNALQNAFKKVQEVNPDFNSGFGWPDFKDTISGIIYNRIVRG